MFFETSIYQRNSFIYQRKYRLPMTLYRLSCFPEFLMTFPQIQNLSEYMNCPKIVQVEMKFLSGNSNCWHLTKLIFSLELLYFPMKHLYFWAEHLLPVGKSELLSRKGHLWQTVYLSSVLGFPWLFRGPTSQSTIFPAKYMAIT